MAGTKLPLRGRETAESINTCEKLGDNLSVLRRVRRCRGLCRKVGWQIEVRKLAPHRLDVAEPIGGKVFATRASCVRGVALEVRDAVRKDAPL